MRKLFLILIILYCPNLFSQNYIQTKINEAKLSSNQVDFKPFTFSNRLLNSNSSAFKENSSIIQLELNQQILSNFSSKNNSFLNFSLPTSESETMEIELIPFNIFGENFNIIDGNNIEIKGIESPQNYIGVVKNEPNSIVSLSIFQNEISVMISTQKGNFELNKSTNSKQYSFYNTNVFLIPPTINCSTPDSSSNKISVTNTISNTGNVTCENIGIYIEVDNESFVSNGSNLQNTTNWANNIFSKVATLYANESINLVISQLKIWNTGNPTSYTNATTSGALLYAFNENITTNYQGRLAHLFSTRALGGGIAWVGTLCIKNYAHGVSTGLSLTTDNLPTYSWNVECVAHEIGHNFGSPHTHSCSWEGGPIDNCSPPEGQCTGGVTPTNGGTIMSYCHLNWGIGINFANGFGTKPGNLIRQKIQECFGTSLAPTNLVQIDSYSNSVILNWNPNFGINGVSLDYRQISSSNWTTINEISTKYRQINGLIANKNYEWRAKRDCSSYSTVAAFSTNNIPNPNWCTNTYANNCFGNGVNLGQLSVNTQNLSTNSGCNDFNSNLFFNPILTFIVGQNYTFSIKYDNNQVQIYTGIWIDFNKNGIFETSEKVYNNTNPTTNGLLTGNLMIPSNINSVTKTRMRIICSYPTVPNDPCGNYNYGETEDYIVNIYNNCVENLVLQSSSDDFSNGNNVKESKNQTGTIKATNKITGSANVIYRAGKSIEFKPGFIAEKGTVFKTEFGGCD